MRCSWISRAVRSSFFLYAVALPVALAQTSPHSNTVTDTRTNSVSNSQTDTVTASTDKQGKPLPSPRHKLDFNHDHNGARTHIVLTYGAPSVRGRTIFGGDVVPYGKWWRAGANEATSFTTDHTVKIGNLTVPAGSYTLDVQPDTSGWQLIINKQTGQWGTQYNPAMDLGRVPMTAAPLSSPQETLNYHFDHVTGTTAILHLRWADKDESVVVSF